MSPQKIVNNPQILRLERNRAAHGGGLPETPPLGLERHQNWPLQEDKLWSTEVLTEYVAKSDNQTSNNPVGAAHTVSAGPNARRSLLEVPSGAEMPMLPAHMRRIHAIEQRIQSSQAEQLSAMEQKLASDEARLRSRIERRLDEVEMRLHIALSEDRERWQK